MKPCLPLACHNVLIIYQTSIPPIAAELQARARGCLEPHLSSSNGRSSRVFIVSTEELGVKSPPGDNLLTEQLSGSLTSCSAHISVQIDTTIVFRQSETT
ncbi:hypothetical protein CesoFtcFv8_003115 [Champsocephalus esox]|uniref:Uncharacterized protein n=1 Tax=Champsocephalus esox TaxID=159716 RepID=A0AAN8CRY1_9TELE|nr:hypothetical protein CesoFtcFv8_003115 [Champsocephalus esox]